MASSRWRVPSVSGCPFSSRVSTGPRAETTASAPATAESMAAASDSSPITTRTWSPQGGDLDRVPGVHRDGVPVGQELVDGEGADRAGGAEDSDVHAGCTS